MTETKKHYTPTRNIADHHTFGGLIYPSDFDRCTSMSDIADRIISDWVTERDWKQNANNRENRENRKSHKTGSAA